MRGLPALTATVTAVVSFAIYSLTIAPDLTWANYGTDGGELITAAVTLGIPHPPGYPTYVVIGNLFSRLPQGTVAYRLNLLSAFSIALAAGFVSACGLLLLDGHRRDPGRGAGRRYAILAAAIAAGLLFAFTPLVWGQALISEVYGLNLLLLAGLLYALMSDRSPWLTGLLFGLSLTTHLTSLFLAPLLLLLSERRQWPRLAAGCLVGLTPMLLMPLLVTHDSPVIWGRPDTLAGWWWQVSGQLYRANLGALSGVEIRDRIADWTKQLVGQLFWLGAMVAAVSWWQLRLNGRDIRLSRTIAGLLATTLLYLSFALVYATPDAITLLLPVCLIWSILLVLGLRYLSYFAMALPLLLLLLNFQVQDLSNDTRVRAQALALFAELPADTVIVSSDTATTFSLWYFHYVEGVRPDTAVIDTNLFAFAWQRDQLRARQPDLFVPEDDDLQRFYLENDLTRPVCFVQLTETNATIDCTTAERS